MANFFSVIIPCYNVAESVLPTLQSVQAQTDRSFEVLAINDGSTDATLSILKGFKADFPMRIVNQENKGLGGARNAGIAAAQGEYLAFLDADDIWEPEKLARVRHALAETGADLICHDEYFVQSETILEEHRYGPRMKYLDLLLEGNCLSPSAVTVRREAVTGEGGFSEDRRGHGVEDYDLWMRLARAGHTFYFLHENLGSYILHETNMSAGADFQERERFILERHFAELDVNDRILARRISKRRALNDACIGWSRFQRGQWIAAFRDYRRALRGDFFGRKVWKYMVFGSCRELARVIGRSLGLKNKGTA
jgi:glycosyltransferase involved in cell wall biosynthesis